VECRIGRLPQLNFKFYRQATNKIVDITESAASFLNKCF